MEIHSKNKECCPEGLSCEGNTATGLQTISESMPQEDACCGFSPEPRSSPLERPGYNLCSFVEVFVDTPCGPVPKIKTFLEKSDHVITILARSGFQRSEYKVSPGLYCVGSPDQDSPVLVTANYRLSFNSLREALSAIDAWVLVLDTRGVNVWCAAGKGTFGTEEVSRQVKQTGLENVVQHRKLVLPQLSATGVFARQVKKECGFRVIWGPIRTSDIPEFLASGMKTDTVMRRVTFTIGERAVLVPVEVTQLHKPTLWVLLSIFVLSGIGPYVYSFSAAWYRGLHAISAYAAGIFAGAVLAPILLPWIPGKAFSLKGAITGFIAGGGVVWMLGERVQNLETVCLILFSMAISSYLAMNFTGATPYTSPSGVEKEMRKAIPFQIAALLVAAILWVTAAFII